MKEYTTSACTSSEYSCLPSSEALPGSTTPLRAASTVRSAHRGMRSCGVRCDVSAGIAWRARRWEAEHTSHWRTRLSVWSMSSAMVASVVWSTSVSVEFWSASALFWNRVEPTTVDAATAKMMSTMDTMEK
eukprot:3936459-Rhodomonas_salina.1